MRFLMVTMACGLLMSLSLPAASATDGLDACVGGIDASDNPALPTALEQPNGCYGTFYRGPTDEESDYNDWYKYQAYTQTRWDTVDFQMCNEGDAIIFWNMEWDGYYSTYIVMDYGQVNPGECSSPEPVTYTSGEIPGHWVVWAYTGDIIMPSPHSDYWLYLAN